MRIKADVRIKVISLRSGYRSISRSEVRINVSGQQISSTEIQFFVIIISSDKILRSKLSSRSKDDIKTAVTVNTGCHGNLLSLDADLSQFN